jgi:hypothetical protein
MTTSQILKSIAHKMGLTFRVPSSESQKLEAINDALPRFTTAAPYIVSVTEVPSSSTAWTVVYSEPVELLSTADATSYNFVLYSGSEAGEAVSGVAISQTSATEITIETDATSISPERVFVTTNGGPAVVSVATKAPEVVAGGVVFQSVLV